MSVGMTSVIGHIFNMSSDDQGTVSVAWVVLALEHNRVVLMRRWLVVVLQQHVAEITRWLYRSEYLAR
jgi:hypothetical protein